MSPIRCNSLSHRFFELLLAPGSGNPIQIKSRSFGPTWRSSRDRATFQVMPMAAHTRTGNIPAHCKPVYGCRFGHFDGPFYKVGREKSQFSVHKVVQPHGKVDATLWHGTMHRLCVSEIGYEGGQIPLMNHLKFVGRHDDNRFPVWPNTLTDNTDQILIGIIEDGTSLSHCNVWSCDQSGMERFLENAAGHLLTMAIDASADMSESPAMFDGNGIIRDWNIVSGKWVTTQTV